MQTFTSHAFPKVSKNNKIQFFRALAIIAVVMIHTTPSGEWQVLCRPFINFSVATFLFLSGYLTKQECEDWTSFYKKRILRVIVPYVIWTLLYSMPSVYRDGIMPILKNLLTANATYTLYYIFVYIQFVLLTPFVIRLAKSRWHILGWAISPLSIIIFKYIPMLGEVEFNGWLMLLWSKSCLGWFSFYYLGLLLGNRILDRQFSLKSLVVLYVLSIVVQMIEGYGWFMMGDINCGTQLKMSSLITSMIFLLIAYSVLKNDIFNLNNKYFRILGDYSFGIYLCHVMVMMIVGLIPMYREIPCPINSGIILVTSFACCYIADKVLGAKISGWIGLK